VCSFISVFKGEVASNNFKSALLFLTAISLTYTLSEIAVILNLDAGNE